MLSHPPSRPLGGSAVVPNSSENLTHGRKNQIRRSFADWYHSRFIESVPFAILAEREGPSMTEQCHCGCMFSNLLTLCRLETENINWILQRVIHLLKFSSSGHSNVFAEISSLEIAEEVPSHESLIGSHPCRIRVKDSRNVPFRTWRLKLMRLAQLFSFLLSASLKHHHYSPFVFSRYTICTN